MISVSNLGKSFGERWLFRRASFQLNAGERYGLVVVDGALAFGALPALLG